MSGLPVFMKIGILPSDFVAEVRDIKWMNKKVASITYVVVEGKFEFEAGQFVNLKFIDPEDGTNEIQRAYSVASAPAGKSGLRFELCIEIIEGGKAGKYFKSLKVGDECKFKGPFGFCILPDSAKKAVMVGTGTGIAPIKGILEDIRNRRLELKVEVLFGFRHWKDRFYLEELNDLASEVNGDFYVCMSQEDVNELDGFESFENLKFVEGRVTSLLSRDDNILSAESDLYICGGSSMINEVREMGLQSGVDKSRIHVEIFD